MTWQSKSLISPQQHGFVANKSTVSNLLVHENYILSAMEKRLQVDSIYTDYSKAFDRVNQELLIAKLSSLGFYGPILQWIQSFLSGRSHIVKIGGCVSITIPVSSGVPQGSHCGPLLFNLFINNLVTIIKHSEVLIFADDVKIFNSISSINDVSLLQEDLSQFYEWSGTNHMDLNISKCYSQTFSRINHPVLHDYSINNIPINRRSVTKDLGIMFDSELNFRSHNEYIISKSLKMLGFINRSCKDFSLNTLKLLYCSLVRSLLEYASIIWCPYYELHIKQIEAVQNTFLRICAYKLGLRRGEYSYNNIREQMNLLSLENRRIIIDVCFLNKILSGSINCEEILSLITINVSRQTRVSTEIFKIPFHPTNYGFFSPLTRMLRNGNKYQQVDVFSSSTNTIKIESSRIIS